jgi:hypothetical protein
MQIYTIFRIICNSVPLLAPKDMVKAMNEVIDAYERKHASKWPKFVGILVEPLFP